MDESFISIWRDIRSSAAIPLWVMALAVVGGLVKAWPLIMDKLNERARDRHTEKASDWTRLRDEIGRLADRVKTLEEECHALRSKVNECETDRLRWMERAIKAESFNEGVGEADQRAQIILSSERLTDAKKKDKP